MKDWMKLVDIHHPHHRNDMRDKKCEVCNVNEVEFFVLNKIVFEETVRMVKVFLCSQECLDKRNSLKVNI